MKYSFGMVENIADFHLNMSKLIIKYADQITAQLTFL